MSRTSPAQRPDGERHPAPDAYVPQEKIAALYDAKAPIYDLWARLTETRARNRALELAELRDGQTVLEVAVGTGQAFYQIVRRNPHGRNLGIDLSPGMLARARRRLRSLDADYQLEIGAAQALPLAAASVDTLVNNYMFDLIPFREMDGILREFRRVLKPDGRLVLVNMTRAEGFGSGVYERIYRLSPETLGGCRGVALAERLADNGFEVVCREYIQQLLFPSEVILARPRNAIVA